MEDRITAKLSELADENLVELIGKKVAEQAKDYAWRKEMREELTDRFNSSRNRMDGLATKAEGTADTFRWLGVVLAVVGLGVAAIKLGQFMLDPPALGQAGAELQLLYSAAVTFPVVLLSEVLALIMFRYHSRALEQMRYYVNEVTTLNLRYGAAMMVVEQGAKKEIIDLARELARQERNYILKKDERTLETMQNAGEDALVRKLMEKMPLKQRSGSGQDASQAPGGS